MAIININKHKQWGPDDKLKQWRSVYLEIFNQELSLQATRTYLLQITLITSL